MIKEASKQTDGHTSSRYVSLAHRQMNTKTLHTVVRGNVPRSFCVLAVNGGFPTSISKQSAPKDHQSTPLPYPFRVSISGAMYSLVPHSVRALSRSPISLAGV